MQFAVTPYGVANTASGFRERWRIENDQVELCSRFVGRAQIGKHVLFHPPYRQLITLRMFPRCGDGVGLHLDADHLACSATGAGQRKPSFVTEAIENASAGR